MSCHDPHRPTFSHAVDQMRAENHKYGDAPPVEWPLLFLVGAMCLLIGVLVTVAAYEIGNCV